MHIDVLEMWPGNELKKKKNQISQGFKHHLIDVPCRGVEPTVSES